ncbi:hypothetical protein [Streptomyces sp. NPDC058613]|uniref:hypothetical protein n=1 Tax=unclassified Streptomyces TaxID=2593676 RepID=UPI00364FA6C0
MSAKYDGLMRALDYDSFELVDEEDLLAALLVIRAIKTKFDIDEARIIGAAREKKVTWQRLAGAMELRSRSSAERRFLQLSEISDSDVRPPRTQAERVEQARIQRSRRAERAWAAAHGARVTLLARGLAAVPDLQYRADHAPNAVKTRYRAHHEAAKEKRDAPEVTMAWPRELLTTLEELKEHPPGTREWPKLIHRLSGLLSHAADPSHLGLDDHLELFTEIRMLYANAGGLAPRQPGRLPALARRRGPVVN